MNEFYIRFPNFRDKAVTLSYDDGVRQDKRLISVMQKYGLKGTFNINAGKFGYNYESEEKGRMTKEEAIELYAASGMEIAMHGFEHLPLGSIDSVIALNDVFTDKKELERLFGRMIKGMAYAYGSYNDETVEILKKCGISYCRTTQATEKFDLPSDWLRLPVTCHHKNSRLMELAQKFVESSINPTKPWLNKPKMFYLWGHSYEFDTDNNWNVIEQFAEYIGGREDIWYATNGEIFEYLRACARLEFSTEATLVYNPSCKDIYINYFGKEYLIPTGETISLR